MKIKQNEIVFLLISSFILVVAWIGFNLYNTSIKPKTDEIAAVQVTPIDPNFDTATLDKLKERVKVEPLYQLKQSAVVATPTATASKSASMKKPTLTITPTAAASAAAKF